MISPRGLPALLLSVAWLGLSAGCEGPPRAAEVVNVTVFTPQVAPRLDPAQPSQGIPAKVMLFADGKTVLGDGILELVMYEGKIDVDQIASRQPLRTWTFSPQDLAERTFRSRYGLWYYQMFLAWEEERPRTAMVTLVARYRFQDGRVLYSGPQIVNVGS